MQFIPTTKLARKREECIPVELEISGAFPKLKLDGGLLKIDTKFFP